jgi:tetratricopeptide (TPR) repeat protein/TolB-like protein
MPSLIPGYEYDIFISYRQKDNKYDGWVTEFVDNLKRELEATFKEEISVYFDINLHDGLLETHDVDASLKEKLKCLVFIPIISRTYCDPRSFAWEHEFKAFIENASKDQFGIKVKLPNGNVANRVLPVRIHDLDDTDIKLCESLLGGVLRGVEFIYKEPGVNRSLTPKDKEKKNLNGTIYRNQINKVALAIKQIIQGMRAEPGSSDAIERPKLNFEEEYIDRKKEKPKKSKKLNSLRLISITALTCALMITGIILVPKIFLQKTSVKKGSSDKRICIAVFPFNNLTNDSVWNNYQTIVQQNLISTLSISPDIQVRQQGNIYNILYSNGYDEKKGISSAFAEDISKKSEADIFIYGMIRKSNSGISIDAQLIETKSGEVIKPFKVSGPGKEEAIFGIIDSLCKNITDFLVVTKILKENWGYDFNYKTSYVTTRSPEALRTYMFGKSFQDKGDSKTALEYFLKSNQIDSNFYDPYIEIPSCYDDDFEENCKWVIKAYNKREQWPPNEKLYASWEYAFTFEKPEVAARYLEQALNIDDQSFSTHRLLAITYYVAKNYEKAIVEFEKAFEILSKWDKNYLTDFPNYGYQGFALHLSGHYEKEKKLWDMAEKYLPDHPFIMTGQAILGFTQKDTARANSYIEKYKAYKKKNLQSEAATEQGLGDIYCQAGMLDKADEHYHKAMSLEPENAGIMKAVADYYIEFKRNLNMVPELMDRAMKLTKKRSDFYNCMDTKGWAYYKMGKNKEAMVILQKVWDEAPYRTYTIRSHYEEVKKAVESQI